MLSYPNLGAKSYYGKIEPDAKIKFLGLDNTWGGFDFKNIERNLIYSVGMMSDGIDAVIKMQTKQYELFVLTELRKRGYDWLRLENSVCQRDIHRISENCERTQFYVDGVLVLTVRQTTRFESTDGRYMFYTDFEVEE